MSAPLRYFGRCDVQGCKHRRVIEHGSHSAVVRETGRNVHGAYDSLVLTDGRANRVNLASNGRGYDSRLLEWMRGIGFTCPEHGFALTWKGGRFTVDPDKVCDGKCLNAVSPACQCSCGGRNHGAGNVVHIGS